MKTTLSPQPSANAQVLQTFQKALGQNEKIEFRGNLPFIFLHIGCIPVLWCGVTPAAFVLFLITLLPRMFGLTGGYHRYFSHRSYKTSRTFQYILALLGCSAFQKDPLWWAAHHRHHHRYADTELDAHPPTKRGFFWAHMGWVMCKKNADLKPDSLVPDLMEYPELVYLNRNQKVVPLSFMAVMALISYGITKLYPGLHTSWLQFFTWGFFISTVFLHHVTFCVNSVAHLFGPRRFETKDTSRNNVWVALLTMGEGWHNNHHRFPSSERQGFYWWELDMTHLILKTLSFFGVVWDLKTPPAEVYEEAKRNVNRGS
ncbi:MAG: acyl-CoA desaturase [Candidatus Omnitrophica bacterium]|nr:acyl-CoA desaturase [Candidatus Omnitrophota bacterium]